MKRKPPMVSLAAAVFTTLAAEQRGIAKGLRMAARQASKRASTRWVGTYEAVRVYEEIASWCRDQAAAITKRAKEGSK